MIKDGQTKGTYYVRMTAKKRVEGNVERGGEGKRMTDLKDVELTINKA